MIALLLSLSLGLARADTLIAPTQGEPAPNDCTEAIPVRTGRPLPSLVAGADGQAVCTGVILPPAQLAYLLKLEAYVKASEKMHMLDVDLLKQERNFYRDQLAIATRSPVWYEKPAVQRWAGRLETLVAVGLAASVVSLRYDGSGGR